MLSSRLEPYLGSSNLISVGAAFPLSEDRFALFQVAFTPEPVHDVTDAEASGQILLAFIGELAE